MATDIGRFGVWTTYHAIGEEDATEAARLVESLGFDAFWLGGSPRLPSVRPLLKASARIAVATGIVNVWAYEPAELAREYAELADEFGRRLLLGVGVGHRERTAEYAAPLAKVNDFLDGLDGAEPAVPRERRVVSALAPRKLELAASRAAGAHTYFVPVEHTARARELLGADALLAVELACVLGARGEEARASARRYAASYMELSNYTNNLRRMGYGEEDLAGGGSDRLIDAVVPQGSAEEIAAIAREHLAAGADHICLQPVGVSGIPRREWTALGAALGFPR